MENEIMINALIRQQKARKVHQGNNGDPLGERAEAFIKAKRAAIEAMEMVSSSVPCNVHMKAPTPKVSPQSTEDVYSYQQPSYQLSQLFSQKAEDEKKKKDKKKQKKKKKSGKRAKEFLGDTLLETNAKKGNLMAELAKSTKDLIIVNGVLWAYCEEDGCFRPCSYVDIAKGIRENLDFEDQMKISSRDYKESYDQLIISGDLERDDSVFFANAPYVNCINGVVDVLNGKLLEHSPEYFFKHCVQANFSPGSECPKFMDYINHITDGDKELKRLIRVIMGYLFSHYNNGKKAILIYGIPHTGKSVLCNVIERVWGKSYVSHVDLAMLSKPEFAASLNGSVLNISADLKNESLRDVGFFKSLVSHDDTIASRALYSNPQDIKCETKMIFSTNHLISFDSSLSVYDIEAVFNRLIYVPYLNKPISDKNDNKHLSDEIYDERDAVFTWAIKGLKDYIENNENFPKAKSSEKLKLKNMAKYCPEKIFFEEAIKKEEGVYESSSDIRATFEVFCQDCEVRGKANIIAFLEEHEHLNKSKKRIDENGNLTSVGNPIYVYEGIRLRNKYRH